MPDTAPDPDDLASVPLPPASDLVGTPGQDPVILAARGAKMLRERAAGMTWEAIAEANGYAGRSGARQFVLSRVTEHEAEQAAFLRRVEHEAFLQDQRVLSSIILNTAKPDATRLRAIDTRTRSVARFARMMGMDAPVQVAVTDGVRAQAEVALAEVEAVVGKVIAMRQVPAAPAEAPEALPAVEEA